MSNNEQMNNTNNKEQIADSNGAQTESNYKISNFGLLNVNNNITLLEAAKPLIKYLNDNYHPMCTAIVTLTNVEILEGIECDNTNEFVKDLITMSNNKQSMTEEEIKNDASVSSRLKHITDEEHLKIIDFIIDYSFKDSQEVYTNGTILVPLFRVIDAISQKGKQYQSY